MSWYYIVIIVRYIFDSAHHRFVFSDRHVAYSRFIQIVHNIIILLLECRLQQRQLSKSLRAHI